MKKDYQPNTNMNETKSDKEKQQEAIKGMEEQEMPYKIELNSAKISDLVNEFVMSQCHMQAIGTELPLRVVVRQKFVFQELAKRFREESSIIGSRKLN